MFRQHLGQVKWRLGLAAVCTVGVVAADLLKPWPLKLILDNAVLNKPLPHKLQFLHDFLPTGNNRPTPLRQAVPAAAQATLTQTRLS